MIRVGYLGYSERMLLNLVDNKDFELCFAIGKSGRVSYDYKNVVATRGINYIEINSKKELLQQTDLFKTVDVILMYKFEFILPASVVDNYRVINFHGGDLRTNRGAHAVVWTILLQEPSTCLSCYQLTGGIDEGLLINQYNVSVFETDTPHELNCRLMDGIPSLLKDIVAFINGGKQAVAITGGTYRRKINETDYTIDLEHDDITTIRGKINSQKHYSGALIRYNGTEYRTKEYYVCRESAVNNENDIIFNSNEFVIFRDGLSIHIFVAGNIS